MELWPAARGNPRSREGVSLHMGMVVFVMQNFGDGEQWWQGRVESVEWNFEPRARQQAKYNGK